jgi:hypothetical protein
MRTPCIPGLIRSRTHLMATRARRERVLVPPRVVKRKVQLRPSRGTESRGTAPDPAETTVPASTTDWLLAQRTVADVVPDDFTCTFFDTDEGRGVADASEGSAKRATSANKLVANARLRELKVTPAMGKSCHIAFTTAFVRQSCGAVDRNTLPWALVVFFGASLLFAAIRRATDDQGTAASLLWQLAAGVLVVAAIIAFVRRRR